MVRRNYRGMRKGISIVEMMIAVLLFGVISTISYKYSKNFYDVSLVAKQAIISSIIEQAAQITNAYDLYEIKKGSTPLTMSSLSDANIRILSETPPKIEEVTTEGWKIADPTAGADRAGLDLDDDSNNNDIAFTYVVDVPTAEGRLEYCNVLNNIEKSSWSLDSTTTDIGDDANMYGNNGFKKIMCYVDADDNNKITLAFIKKIVP